jgi:hypothetical protein
MAEFIETLRATIQTQIAATKPEDLPIETKLEPKPSQIEANIDPQAPTLLKEQTSQVVEERKL